MVLDRAVPRDSDEGLRRELKHEGHDGDVRAGLAHGPCRLGPAKRFEAIHPDARRLRGGAQGVRTRGGPFRCAEDGCHLVAARDKRFQDCLAEVPLTEKSYSNGSASATQYDIRLRTLPAQA